MENLHAEPLFARWIRTNVAEWREAAVVSKNPGGTRRVTSLADALKLNFALVTTHRRRNFATTANSLEGSAFFDRFAEPLVPSQSLYEGATHVHPDIYDPGRARRGFPENQTSNGFSEYESNNSADANNDNHTSDTTQGVPPNIDTSSGWSPDSQLMGRTPTQERPRRVSNMYIDERAREVITGRLIHGRIVDDDVPSPGMSTRSTSTTALNVRDGLEDDLSLLMLSRKTTVEASSVEDDDEEDLKDPEIEHTITLVGNVRDRPVLIIDDMIDQAGSWIAAAETAVKRGQASAVYCIATHGLFGEDALEQMEACECIDWIVVSNTHPIAVERVQASSKLVVLDLSHLLSEAIRRLHYGESTSSLFSHDAE